MAYERINWEDAPSTETPLSSENLNTMDAALANIDQHVSAADEVVENLQQDVELVNARLDTIVERPEGATGIYNIIDGNAVGSARTTGGIDSSEYPLGNYAFAEGRATKATGLDAHAEGSSTEASGWASHTEGYGATASEPCSHAEGRDTTASGSYSHAEGQDTVASANASHAEGYHTTASGSYYSHAEGHYTTASGNEAHAEGDHTTASGRASHAEGTRNEAKFRSQHVGGEYAITDPSEAASTERGTYAEIIGNGTSNSSRSNARTLDWEGNEVLAGDLTINGNQSVGDGLSSLQTALTNLTNKITIEGTKMVIHA